MVSQDPNEILPLPLPYNEIPYEAGYIYMYEGQMLIHVLDCIIIMLHNVHGLFLTCTYMYIYILIHAHVQLCFYFLHVLVHISGSQAR